MVLRVGSSPILHTNKKLKSSFVLGLSFLFYKCLILINIVFIKKRRANDFFKPNSAPFYKLIYNFIIPKVTKSVYKFLAFF